MLMNKNNGQDQNGLARYCFNGIESKIKAISSLNALLAWSCVCSPHQKAPKDAPMHILLLRLRNECVRKGRRRHENSVTGSKRRELDQAPRLIELRANNAHELPRINS